MTTVGTEQSTTQVYRVHIRASPQAVWDAITQPEWNARYGYGGRGEYDLRLGGKYRVLASEEQKKGGEEMGFPTPDVVVDGEVIEAQAPHRLVQTWRMDMDPEMIAEGYTQLTYEIKEVQPGVTRLTVTHDLRSAPRLAVLMGGGFEDTGAAGGGWSWILSDLKTLLETGRRLAD